MAAPGAGYRMLRSSASGWLLAAGPDGSPQLASRGDDAAMWSEVASAAGGFAHATQGELELAAAGGAAEGEGFCLTCGGRLLRDEGGGSLRLQERGAGDSPGSLFTVEVGPVSLPSAHLAELRATGMTVVTVASPAAVAEMRAVIEARMQAVSDVRRRAGKLLSGEEGTPPHEFTLDEPLLPLEPPVGEFGWLCFASSRFAELNAHPVQLWLLEQFMGCAALSAHPPAARINMPEEYWAEVEGARGGEGGWHLDTPYAWQELKDYVAATDSGVFPVERPLGVRECAGRDAATAARCAEPLGVWVRVQLLLGRVSSGQRRHPHRPRLQPYRPPPERRGASPQHLLGAASACATRGGVSARAERQRGAVSRRDVAQAER